MGISQYIKEIGRGKQGARPISREQAADLFGQVLDGSVTDLEVGAFCLAMRIKGETTAEMAGFIDATQSRLHRVPTSGHTAVVLPSYNGARRLPVLTPLLALLVARRGLPVVMHGTTTEASRVGVPQVLELLGHPSIDAIRPVAPGEVVFVPTALLCPGLKRLLDVRRVVGLRNSSHSLVKLIDPCDTPSVVVSSYTHPEYAISMGEVFELMGTTAMLIRGTEGEAVADARRLPQMTGFVRGERRVLEVGVKGTVTGVPLLPEGTDPGTTAEYITSVLQGRLPVPASVELQVEHILRLAQAA